MAVINHIAQAVNGEVAPLLAEINKIVPDPQSLFTALAWSIPSHVGILHIWLPNGWAIHWDADDAQLDNPASALMLTSPCGKVTVMPGVVGPQENFANRWCEVFHGPVHESADGGQIGDHIGGR